MYIADTVGGTPAPQLQNRTYGTNTRDFVITAFCIRYLMEYYKVLQSISGKKECGYAPFRGLSVCYIAC